MENGAKALRADKLTKNFELDGNKIKVLSGADLTLTTGKTTGIVGASGTGKSTLLHILGGLDKPDSGTVMIGDDDIFQLSDTKLSKVRSLKIGFVFQFHHLLPEFSAIENALLPAMISGRDMKEAKKEAIELFDMVGLSERVNHRPGKLSGGEKQRSAIVRALVNSPQILLADEPTGNLDEETAGSVFKLLVNLTKEKKLATVIVTHNPFLAKSLDRKLELNAGLLTERSR